MLYCPIGYFHIAIISVDEFPELAELVAFASVADERGFGELGAFLGPVADVVSGLFDGALPDS